MHRAGVALALALAALSFPALALGAGVSPGVATPVQREQSQTLFLRGKGLFDAKRYSEALVEFRAAMDIVASPNARLYVARCLRQTGKLVEAYVEFDRTSVEANEHAREDSRYQRTGSSAQVERDAIAAKIGFVLVRVDGASDATTIHIAGEEVRRAGWGEPVPVMPGDVEVVAETPPSAAVRKTVTVGAGEKQTVVLDGSAAPVAVAATAGEAHAVGLRPYAYAAAAVGAAGFVTFAIAGGLSDATYTDLSSQCGSHPCPASKQSEVTRGQTEQTAANVGLGVGIAGLAAGVTLFLLSLRSHGEATPAPAAHPVEASVAPGWVGVMGTF